MIKGTCLCGGISFEIQNVCGPFELCHCNKCRKVSGSAFMSGVYVRRSDFQFLKGEDLISIYTQKVSEKPPGYTSCFCKRCGSPIPLVQENVELVEIPAGLIDGDLSLKPDRNIFVEHKADWFEIQDGIPKFTKQEIRAFRKSQQD